MTKNKPLRTNIISCGDSTTSLKAKRGNAKSLENTELSSDAAGYTLPRRQGHSPADEVHLGRRPAVGNIL